MEIALLMGFLFGIPSSFLATFIYDRVQNRFFRAVSVDIEGTWGELARNSQERQCSLGIIYWDRKRRIYAFDGTSYSNAGAPYGHWTTVSSYLDTVNAQFFYTFRAQIEDRLDRTYYGFGVVNLVRDERGNLSPINGHYISANVDTQVISHSMMPVSAMRYSRSAKGVEVNALIRRLAGAE